MDYINMIDKNSINSAMAYDEKQKEIDKIRFAEMRRDNALNRMANSNDEQVKLLKQQLSEVKLQNDKLKENNIKLQEINQQLVNEINANSKIAKQSKIISIISLCIAIVVGILGIIF